MNNKTQVLYKYKRSMKNYISRSIINGKYAYSHPKYGRILDQIEIDRINKLRIPPAWTSVNINANKKHDLLATGIDKSGKTQYIYNPKFVLSNNKEKFIRLGLFITVKNKICNFISYGLKEPPNSVDFIMALLFEILFLTSMRVGNDIYDTYGLTTLEKRHVSFEPAGVYITFIGKKSIKHTIFLNNKHEKVISSLKLLHFRARYSNHKIFEPVTSAQLNTRLRDITNEDITCKDFRTYGANRLFVQYLRKGYNIKDIVKLVSNELGHGSDIFKKSYVIPELLTEPVIDNKNPDIVILDIIQKYY